jgi:hypothetical protein
MSHRVRRTVTAALLPLALVTACSGDEPSAESSSGPPASSTPSETPPASSPTPAVTGEPVRRERFFRLFSDALERATTAHLTLSAGGASPSIGGEGDVDYTSEPPSVAMRLTKDQAGEGIAVRMVDGALFVQLPMLAGRWVRMDLSDPDSPLGPALGEAFDLRSVLDGFRAGLRRVVLVGEEQVDGQAQRHYRVTTDPGAVAERLGSPAPSPSAPSASSSGDLPDEVTYDVWFDGAGLLRRLGSDLGPGLGTVDLRLSHWGEDVDVEPPPADDVIGTSGSSGG